MRRITPGALVGIILIAICLLLARNFSSEKARYDQRIQKIESARPLHAEVDFSKPGEYVFPFNEDYESPDGEVYCLKTDPPFESEKKALEAIEGFKAKMTLLDNEGKEFIKECDFPGNQIDMDYEDKTALCLIWFKNWNTGQLIFKLQILSGAPALEGKKQILFSKYRICFAEKTPGTFCGFLVYGCRFIAGIIALCILPSLFKSLFFKKPLPPISSSDS